MKLNPTVHRIDEKTGDPERTETGELKLRTNWKDLAVDHKGRKFSPAIHGDTATLDDDGLLKMKRRDPNRKPMGMVNRTEAFVAQYKENGYVYRVVNDDPGRIDQFKKYDWEQVIGKDGTPAMQHAGQARQAGTKSYLMKKPEEWYEEDQQKKDAVLKNLIATKTKPNEAEGQYDKGGLKPASVLR